MKKYPHTKNANFLKQIPSAEIVRINVQKRVLEILNIGKNKMELVSTTPLVVEVEKKMKELEEAPFYILSSAEARFDNLEKGILQGKKEDVGVYIFKVNLMSTAKTLFGRDYPCDNKGNPKKSDGPGVVFEIATKSLRGHYSKATHLMCPSFTDMLNHEW